MAKENPHLEELRKRVSKAPTDPGVYRWLDTAGNVLYVGKAKNLRSRLKAYVQKKPDKSIGPWKLSLIQKLADLDVTVTRSELEALVLETNLIKELKPKYNVLMKDDKNYVYVKITIDDEYPAIDVVRRIEDDGAKYFGPYLSAFNIKRTLEMLHTVFNFRACERSLNRLNAEEPLALRSPKGEGGCLDYQIGKCNGLCVGEVTKEQYVEGIEEVIHFLKGNRSEVTERLHDLMNESAEQKKFERAAKLRDTLQYIEKLNAEEQVVSDTSMADTDVFGVAMQSGKAQVVLLRERGGRVIGELSFPLTGEAETSADVLAQFLPQYYASTTDFPDTIIIGEEVEGQESLADWLTDRKKKKVTIHVPERGKKSKLLLIAEKNAEGKVQQQFAKWEAAAKNIEDALEELKKTLDLPSNPKRIEGYDISHLSGTETVGSMVVIRNGKAANDQYRSFTLRTLKEGEVDDYKALNEVLKRRFRHLTQNIKEEEKQWKEKGLTFGKVRKAEQKNIDKIHDENPDTLSKKDIDYKQFLVVRKDDSLIGFCRIFEHKGDHKELKSLWIHPDAQGEKLGQFLIRKTLSLQKKTKKVYLTTESSLEQYYCDVGFRHVQSPPEVIIKETKNIPDVLVMVYIYADHKSDASLQSCPDLIVVDGGVGQLNAGLAALKEANLSIPMIGLAKREEDVFAPGEKGPVHFPKDSPAKFLLMRLRDEAHRFANRHREQRGKKSALGSALDGVPGIGEKAKGELLKAFGSVTGVKQASDADLQQVLSAQQVEELRKHLQ